jgi:lysophospholipase
MRDKRAHRWALLLLAFASSASADSVTDYAPTVGVTCPDTPLLRLFDTSNQTLHPFEAEYIASRERDVLPNAWSDWIGDGSAIGYDAKQLLANASRVGIAVSGGGYRASLYGAGVLNALDSRNQSSKAAGTGGLLQVASYIIGLSGEFAIPAVRVCRH